MEIKNIMPERFVSTIARRDTDAALRRAERELNNYANRLAEMREIPQLIADLAKVNEDFIKKAIIPRLEAVKNDLSLTEDERDEKLKTWNIISTTARKYANAITDIVNQWPDVEWQFDEKENYYYAVNATEVVDKRSTFDVPQEAKEHYDRIRNAFAAIQELREWEKSQDAKTVALVTLVRLTPSQLAEAWHSGDARVDHRFDHLPGVRHDDLSGTIII